MIQRGELTKAELQRLLELLNAELAKQDTLGEVYVVGGAVMCLAFDARESTRDVDAVFRPAREVREAASRVARRADVPDGWLNDAVKGLLGTRGEYDLFLELDHLRVFVAQAPYLLAMKCAAMRLTVGSHDLDDVRYLLRYLNVSTRAEAMGIVTQYFDEAQLPPKTRLALEELLPG